VLVLAVAWLVPLVLAAAVALVAVRWPRVDPAAPSGNSVASEVAERRESGPAAGLALPPGGTTILGLSAAAVAVVASGLAVGLLFLLVRSRAGFGTIDLGAARWAERNATSTSTDVLGVLTYLGSTVVALPLVVAVGLLELRRVPNRSIPAFLLLVEGGQLLLSNLIKVLVDRARPDLKPLAKFMASSFPSGHTTTAAATFVALALLIGRRRSPTVRVALAGAAAGLTALVACTRVLLGVHWTTDVLAGAALGWGWAALCSIAFGGRLLRFGGPVEQGLAAPVEPRPGGGGPGTTPSM